MDQDIPYIDFNDTLASLRTTLAQDALVRVKRRDWEKPKLVQDLDLWKQRIMQTDDPTYMQWCWLSTAFSAPSWSRMTSSQIKDWTPVWLHFLRMDEHSWSLVEPLENGRLETQWIRHLREVVHTQSAQPLLDWWRLRAEQGGQENDHNFFWKAAYATLADSPTVAASLNPAWVDELSQNRTDPELLFDWSRCAAQTLPKMPTDFRVWIRTLLQQDLPVARLLQFRQDDAHAGWQEDVVCEVLHGICLQEHTPPWPHLATNVQQLWAIVPSCSYPTRLDIAKNFLESKTLEISSERWPLDYKAMERVIQKAAPSADMAQWGTAPWLAGLLHILPEFATVLLFHDVLPVSPAQAHSLVLLYKDNCEWAKHPDLYKFSSELFENDTITI